MNAPIPDLRRVRFVPVDLWGTLRPVYDNANLSIYSAQTCNGGCRFCVEELRPAARGRTLAAQRHVEADDTRYLEALDEVLRTLKPLDPSVSITGGEPSLDPRLPQILRLLHRHDCRKRTMTTNGTGLLRRNQGRRVIDWLTSQGIRHLNISRAHPERAGNAELMQLSDGLSDADLRRVARRARDGGTRVRLSCALLRGAIDDLDGIVDYLDFARSLGVDNVVFRQLMLTDPRRAAPCPVTRYSDRHRVALRPVLNAVAADSRFVWLADVTGYYYDVEVWRYRDVDVVFEEADLSQLESSKREQPGVIQELVFHPNAKLCSTWQPWDGELGPGGG